jgi:DNA-binding MurR/RpiR family transcriptional regulator
MDTTGSLEERIVATWDRLGPGERVAARYLLDHAADAVVATAAQIGRRSGVSDATVIRTARALGYAGLPALRRELAAELGAATSAAGRMSRSFAVVGEDPHEALLLMVDLAQQALEELRTRVTAADFQRAVVLLHSAQRILLFGIGPTAPIAEYGAFQLRRVGLDARAITLTGLQFADQVNGVQPDDCLVVMAYGRVHVEVRVLLAEARSRGASAILISDTLAASLAGQVDVALPARRGRSGLVSSHAATLPLLEALTLALAHRRSDGAMAALERLNELRAALVGHRIDVGRPDFETS